MGGHTLQLPCQKPKVKAVVSDKKRLGFAYNFCLVSGEWSSTANTSQCAYTSAVTDTLHKFATMNTSFFNSATLLQSAKHFLNYTQNPSIFQDPMDIVYFSQAVENYMPYLDQPSRNIGRRTSLFGGQEIDNNVGRYMMDMIANILGVPSELMGLGNLFKTSNKPGITRDAAK